MKLYDFNRRFSCAEALRDNEPETPYRPDASRFKVLAVDDDPQVRRLMARILDPERFAVVCAAGFDEAIRLVEQITPDTVLLDLHLTHGRDKNGITCLRTLRQNGYGKPIYILSGDDSIQQVLLAAKFGANGYLVKRSAKSFWTKLEALLKGEEKASGEPEYPNLSPAAEAYLESRGLTEWDLQLLNTYSNGFQREKEIARITGRNHDAIRKSFQLIRDKLGADSQVELGRILGVLACFMETLK